MKFKFGELFCGPGGLGLAAKSAKLSHNNEEFSIEHAWSTDYDRDSCLTYTYNICPENPKSVVCKDIRQLDIASLRKISEIDALGFGFPCNDFSIVGEQKGMDGVYGPLYSYGAKTMEIFQPKWFLAENVAGLKNANEGDAFKKILSTFYDMGYSVYPHLYKFNEYGVPQNRQRILIIGIRKDLDVVYRVPSTRPFRKIDISVKNAIENPPIQLDATNNELTRQSQQVIERLKHIKPGENAFTANIPENLRLNVKAAQISQIYKRLVPDKPSYTITGSGGGGTHVYHWQEDRALTNRERARIQTFPDDFVFIGSKESVRKQIGMAVPARGAQVIFEAILKSFAGVEYDWVPNNINPLIHDNHKKRFFGLRFSKDVELNLFDQINIV
ncbi:MAG: DNA cytosine methyltransferase [Bacteroidetes bacterium]|nr:DNA cytosine methyltransferase [Bacteroidota bacterium]